MPSVIFTLYGMARGAHGGRTLSLEVPSPCTVRQAQDMLLEKIPLNGQAIALATAERVLRPDDELPLTGEVAVLPPVCGG